MLKKPQVVQLNSDGVGTEASLVQYFSNQQHQELATALSEGGGGGSFVMSFEEEKYNVGIFGKFLYQNHILKNVLLRKQRTKLFLL
jgi:hypothetical protein